MIYMQKKSKKIRFAQIKLFLRKSYFKKAPQ